MNQITEDRIKQIIDFAQKNGGEVTLNRVMDILYDKNDSITAEEVQEAKRLISENDVKIIGNEDEGYEADSVESGEFIPAYVNIGQRPLNVYNLMERLANDEIDMMPAFQRHKDLWSLKNQSRLIESLMLKIPLPAFYFNAAKDDKWVVIDGLQRLTAFQNFLIGKKVNGERIKEKFVDMQYLTEFNGKTFDELPRQYIRRIKETSIIAYTVEKDTPDQIVHNIFQRINTGGLHLEPQEIRQALYVGKATKLIQELAICEEFLRATQSAISPDRMMDREYVNRYIAFTELDFQKEYKGNIDDFLIKAIKKVDTYDDVQVKRLASDFRRTMQYCALIFGKYAFRRYDITDEKKRRGPINKAIFEIWSICLSELTQDQLEYLVARKDDVVNLFGNLLQDQGFAVNIKSGDQYSTSKRIAATRDMLRGYLNDK